MTYPKLVNSVILSLFSACHLFSQDSLPAFVLNENDLQGITITIKTYSKSSLWGYIDGGADLYLEYGFENLFLQEILYHNRKYKIEYYEMTDPDAAFGIYSVSVSKCKLIDSLSLTNCVIPYQIQIVNNRFYISIINEKGSGSEQSDCLVFLKTIINKIKNPSRYTYPAVFCDDLFLPHLQKLRAVKGILGLQNGYPDWNDRFESFSGFKMFLLPVSVDKKSFIAASIAFNDSTDLKRFIDAGNFTDKSDQWYINLSERKTEYAQLLSPTQLLFCETDMPQEESAVYLKALISR